MCGRFLFCFVFLEGGGGGWPRFTQFLFDVVLFCLGCHRAPFSLLIVALSCFFLGVFYSALAFSGSVVSNLQSSNPFTS